MNSIHKATNTNIDIKDAIPLFSSTSIKVIYWMTLILFMANKFMIRPFVLEHGFSEWIITFVLSFPNLCEAIVGSINLVGIITFVNMKWISPNYRLGEKAIYAWSLVAAGIFVITQEFKIHNLGGRNVYDPYDVLFSVLGLITSYFLFLYIRPLRGRMSTLSPEIKTNRTELS